MTDRDFGAGEVKIIEDDGIEKTRKDSVLEPR